MLSTRPRHRHSGPKFTFALSNYSFRMHTECAGINPLIPLRVFEPKHSMFRLTVNFLYQFGAPKILSVCKHLNTSFRNWWQIISPKQKHSCVWNNFVKCISEHWWKIRHFLFNFYQFIGSTFFETKQSFWHLCKWSPMGGPGLCLALWPSVMINLGD